MTKPVTAVAMMILYEEKKWQLDDPITKYIPELANLKVFRSLGPDGKPVRHGRPADAARAVAVEQYRLAVSREVDDSSGNDAGVDALANIGFQRREALLREAGIAGLSRRKGGGIGDRDVGTKREERRCEQDQCRGCVTPHEETVPSKSWAARRPPQGQEECVRRVRISSTSRLSRPARPDCR
jgi:hypothetical protein